MWSDYPCKEWQGARTKGGYGQRARSSGTSLVHRQAWEGVNGPIPVGLCVCHHCDNPPCYELEHLFLGTYQENMEDMMRKGRGNPPARVFDKAEIIRRWIGDERQSVLAREYGVSRQRIWQIVSFRND